MAQYFFSQKLNTFILFAVIGIITSKTFVICLKKWDCERSEFVIMFIPLTNDSLH